MTIWLFPLEKPALAPRRRRPARPGRACGCRPRPHRRRGSAGAPRPGGRVSIFSLPVSKVPARASRPSRSSAAWRSAASIRSPDRRESDVAGLERAGQRALELALGLRRFERRRSTPIHAPRPGALARTSGSDLPSGPEREPDQIVARAMLPGQDALALGTCVSSRPSPPVRGVETPRGWGGGLSSSGLGASLDRPLPTPPLKGGALFASAHWEVPQQRPPPGGAGSRPRTSGRGRP
jgi:hypothetical protein